MLSFVAVSTFGALFVAVGFVLWRQTSTSPAWVVASVVAALTLLGLGTASLGARFPGLWFDLLDQDESPREGSERADRCG